MNEIKEKALFKTALTVISIVVGIGLSVIVCLHYLIYAAWIAGIVIVGFICLYIYHCYYEEEFEENDRKKKQNNYKSNNDEWEEHKKNWLSGEDTINILKNQEDIDD